MKKLKLGLFILLALMLMLTPLLGACAPPAPKGLKIGALVGLTGPGSEALARLADGIQAATDWINEKGGLTIKGDTYLIELIIEDTKMSPDGVIAAANKLVYDHKVKFVVGPVVPWLAMASAPVTEEAKVLRCKIDGCGAPDELNPDTPYTFTTFPQPATIPYLYDYLLEAYPGVKKVALICPDEPGSLFDRELSKKEAEGRGLTVVLEEAYPFGTADFYPLWTKIMAAEPDAVEIGPGFAAWYGAILKQGRELGFKGPVCTFSGSGDVRLIRDIAGRDLATDYFEFDFDLKSPEMTPMIKEIATIISDKYGVELATDHLYGWEALWCMAQAIEEAQSLDPTEVMKSWEKMTSIETPFGTGTMGGLKTCGLNHIIARPYAITRIMNGEVEHVKWVMPEAP